jgi:hypothetical protein
MSTTNTRMHMKFPMRTLASLFLLAVVAAWWGCKPEVDAELGEPFDKLEGMIGSWELGSFSQTDLQNALKESRDLSELYIDGVVTPLQIVLNDDWSYSVSIEKGRNYFGEGGTWGLDDETHHSYLFLYTEVDGVASDTLQYNLGGVVRTFDNVFDIVYERPCDGEPVLEYTFSFNRIQ